MPRRRRGGMGWETWHASCMQRPAGATGHRFAWPVALRRSATSRQTTKSDRLSHRARRGINELRVGFRREDPKQGGRQDWDSALAGVAENAEKTSELRSDGQAGGLFLRYVTVPGDLVRLGNGLARNQAIGQQRARPYPIGVHQAGDIVAGIDANVHRSLTVAARITPG